MLSLPCSFSRSCHTLPGCPPFLPAPFSSTTSHTTYFSILLHPVSPVPSTFRIPLFLTLILLASSIFFCVICFSLQLLSLTTILLFFFNQLPSSISDSQPSYHLHFPSPPHLNFPPLNLPPFLMTYNTFIPSYLLACNLCIPPP